MSDHFIHPSAIVSERSLIGEGTKIWVNVHIREDSIIGRDCIIGKDCYIDQGVRIGSGVKIQNGVSVFRGVSIEDDVFVGPNVVFTNDRVPRAFNTEWAVTPTFVRQGASLGANSTVICGVTIGEYAIIGAGSVVTRDVEPFSLVAGNPARHRYYVDRMGNRVND